VLLMEAGEKLAAGLPKQMMGRYQKLLYAPPGMREIICEQIRQANNQVATMLNTIDRLTAENLKPVAYEQIETFDPHFVPSSTIEHESHGPLIGLPTILTQDGRRVNGLVRGRKYRYRYLVSFNQSATKVRFGMSIKSTSGFSIGGALSAPSLAAAIPLVKQGSIIKVEFTFYCNLNPGVFFMNAGVFGTLNGEEVVLHRRADIVAFRVLPIQDNIETEMISLNFESDVSLNA